MTFLTSAFALAVVLLWASLASASPKTFCPPAESDVCYSIGVPPSTVSAGSGDIYIQIRAPSSGFSWAGIGIGSQMAGATIFVMYTDGNGNVTISGRDGGQGHVMPEYSATIQDGITLLDGSGVSSGTMTANFKYSVSSSTLNVLSSSTNWISAWRSGNALDSTQKTVTIEEHDVGSSPGFQQFSLDLTQATTSSDSNPFISTTSESNTTASGGGSNSSSSSGIVVVVDESPKYLTAHGVLMACAMVVLFPVGAIVMRVLRNVWLHVAIQAFALCAIIAGFGVGIRVAQLKSLLFNNAHTICGTVVFCLFLIQPFLGLLHHRLYRRFGKRTFVSYAHIWYGRAILIIGIINGGIGLKLADNAHNYEIAYGALAGAIFLVYVATIILTGRRKQRSIKSPSSMNAQ